MCSPKWEIDGARLSLLRSLVADSVQSWNPARKDVGVPLEIPAVDLRASSMFVAVWSGLSDPVERSCSRRPRRKARLAHNGELCAFASTAREASRSSCTGSLSAVDIPVDAEGGAGELDPAVVPVCSWRGCTMPVPQTQRRQVRSDWYWVASEARKALDPLHVVTAAAPGGT
jgi:hypothetical protein